MRRLHDRAQQYDHNVAHIIMRGSHVRAIEQLQDVVHYVDALRDLATKVDRLVWNFFMD